MIIIGSKLNTFFHLLYARWEFEGLPLAQLYAVDMSEFF
jgi:hypothetical protein